MQVADAFVSGSLGRAIYFREGIYNILDAPGAEPRAALPNDIHMFRHAAFELVSAHLEGLPVPIERLRAVFQEEVLFFRGLDGLLIGMDPDMSETTRARGIRRAETVLAEQPPIANRIRERFLVPADAREWDPSSGMGLAQDEGADVAAACYRLLADGIVDRLVEDIDAIVIEQYGGGVEAAQNRETILRSGLLSEAAGLEGAGDHQAVSRLAFRGGDFPKLASLTRGTQVLAALQKRIQVRLNAPPPLLVEMGLDIDDEEIAVVEATDPIVAAAELVVAERSESNRHEVKGGARDVPAIQSQIDWIGERLQRGEVARAEQALVQLVRRQATRSRPEDVIKSLTAVADLARQARLFDLTWRVLSAIDVAGTPDAAALSVRGNVLRDLGRFDEALAALDATIQRFPENVVARNARAEVLRDLGRFDEALAALDATIERFPENVVARNARAEVLRDLGRFDEALASLESTIERFPENVVARTARAEVLRDLGRFDEALAALDATIERLPDNVVARNARAEVLRDLGRPDEALAALDATIERFPENVVARNARAEVLRDLGRFDEALAALDATIDRFPANVVARVARAEALRDLGRPDEALAALDATIERFPADVVPRTARAEVLRDLGLPDEALAALDATIERLSVAMKNRA